MVVSLRISEKSIIVMPAQAGIQKLGSRFRGNDDSGVSESFLKSAPAIEASHREIQCLFESY